MPRTRFLFLLVCLTATLLACQFVTGRFTQSGADATPQASEELPQATEAQPPGEPPATVIVELPTPTTALPEQPTEALPPTEAPAPEEPLSAWKDIPIMPGATQAKDEGSVYSYKIASSNAAIEEYYQTELTRLGWAPFASGSGDGTDNLFLMFHKGEQMVTIATVDQNGLVMVVISVL